MTTRYRICVKGRLDASWSDRMAGLSITTDRDLDGAVTTLEGEVRDQSELTGVLDTLSDLNMTLIRVESIADFGDSRPARDRVTRR